VVKLPLSNPAWVTGRWTLMSMASDVAAPVWGVISVFAMVVLLIL
jgi:hypothetical protein